MSKHATNTAPDWFQRAVATPPEDRFVSVDGCRIHYLRWGQAGKPGLCFVHGGFAHAHWWDWTAPFFTGAFNVVALDLGGMGDSGHREKYSLDTFAEEVAAVCAHADLDDSPAVVGHSFGGLVALRRGALSGARMGGIVLVDFPIRPPGYERDYGQPADDLARLHCRVAAIYGECSALFPPEIREYMGGLLAGRAPMIAVPEAHHHLFLDQPLAFVVALRALLATWKLDTVNKSRA